MLLKLVMKQALKVRKTVISYHRSYLVELAITQHYIRIKNAFHDVLYPVPSIRK